MTSSVIKSSTKLKDNKWVINNGISAIKLKQKANVYLNDNDIIYLDSSNEILYVSENPNIEGSLSTSLKAYKAKYKIDIDFIGGFIYSSHLDNGVLK